MQYMQPTVHMWQTLSKFPEDMFTIEYPDSFERGAVFYGTDITHAAYDDICSELAGKGILEAIFHFVEIGKSCHTLFASQIFFAT